MTDPNQNTLSRTSPAARPDLLEHWHHYLSALSTAMDAYQPPSSATLEIERHSIIAEDLEETRANLLQSLQTDLVTDPQARMSYRLTRARIWVITHEAHLERLLASKLEFELRESSLNADLAISRARLAWFQAVRDVHGNIDLAWDDDGCSLSNGERYDLDTLSI